MHRDFFNFISFPPIHGLALNVYLLAGLLLIVSVVSLIHLLSGFSIGRNLYKKILVSALVFVGVIAIFQLNSTQRIWAYNVKYYPVDLQKRMRAPHSSEYGFIDFVAMHVKEPHSCKVIAGAHFGYIRYALYPLIKRVEQSPFDCVIVYKKENPEQEVPRGFQMPIIFDDKTLIVLRK